MKFLGSLFFIVLISFTWRLIHSVPSIPYAVHAELQNQIATLMQKELETKKPMAQDFAINQMWTEKISDNKVKAVFAFSYLENTEDATNLSRNTTEGEAILERKPSISSEKQTWTISSLKTSQDKIEFQNALEITAGESDSAQDSTQTEPPQPTGQAVAPQAPVPNSLETKAPTQVEMKKEAAAAGAANVTPEPPTQQPQNNKPEPEQN